MCYLTNTIEEYMMNVPAITAVTAAACGCRGRHNFSRDICYTNWPNEDVFMLEPYHIGDLTLYVQL